MRNEEIIVNVIFDAARGNVARSGREARVGQPLGELPRPTRAGYTFAGWTLNGTLVTEETVLTEDADVRLVAQWERQVNTLKKTSMYKRQRVAAIVLLAVTVVLALTLVFVNHITSIYGMVDTYYGEDGEVQTQKYYVRKKNGAYGLYDRKGNRMDINEQGYYIVASGNQYSVDPETGECTLYAVVDYDAAGGEVLGFSDRIMLFPQIKQADVYSIKVQNEYGEYMFYRDETGKVLLSGYEDAVFSYDQELYASLCVSCGYTLSTKKLDLTSEQSTVARLEDGSVDYSAYGLADSDKPAVYTITKAIYRGEKYEADPNTVYSVKVGDAILSGGGYYVQMVGRDAIYVVSTTIGNTVLQPVESMVTPMVAYPSGMSTYTMVNSFLIGKVDMQHVSALLAADKDLTADDIDTIAAFSYWDLESRQNSIYTSRPYIHFIENFMSGYNINNDNATSALSSLYEMQYIACRKLGFLKDKDSLREYGLDGDVFCLMYESPVTDENNAIEGYMQNTMLISQKTKDGTYFIASFLTDMIVEVDQYYLSFLQWEMSDWYYQYFFSQDISHITSMSFQVGDQKYDFRLDNAASYMYYEASGKIKQVDLEKGKILNGKYVDQNGQTHEIKRFDFQNGASYLCVFDSSGKEVLRKPFEKYLITVDRSGNTVLKVYDSADSDVCQQYDITTNTYKYGLIYVDPIQGEEFQVMGSYSNGSSNVASAYRLPVWQEQYNKEKEEYQWVRLDSAANSVGFYSADGKSYTPSRNSSNLYVYCDQYTGGTKDPTCLDYTIVYSFTNDKQETETEQLSAVDNFRKVYSMLCYYSIEGDVDPEEFEKNMGMSMEEYIKTGNCQATFTYRYEDFAENLNFMTGTLDNEDTSPEIKVWKENNSGEIIIRLYQYSDRKSLLTIETVGATKEVEGEGGAKVEVPVGEQGTFYVQADYANELIRAVQRLLNGERVENK